MGLDLHGGCGLRRRGKEKVFERDGEVAQPVTGCPGRLVDGLGGLAITDVKPKTKSILKR
jgi:hypothetical protein